MIPIEGMKTVPGYHKDDFMMAAFVGLIRFAWGKKEIRDQFQKETGINLSRIIPRSPIEAMIDEVCGYDGKEDFIAFADWVNVNLWGEEEKGGGG